jgi:glycosyltransferase involved in cell wall biosynthesis
VQKEDLTAELGVDRDQVRVIPNPVDIPQFRQDGIERDGTILYVDGRESDLRVLYRRLITPEHRRRLRVIDSEHRVSQGEYVRLLNSASIAICLSPSGDSTTTRLFEFAAAGLPFVTWRSRGMEPLLPSGSYGDLLDDDSIQWTLDNQESLSKSLKKESERFSYEATLIRMQEMFR